MNRLAILCLLLCSCAATTEKQIQQVRTEWHAHDNETVKVAVVSDPGQAVIELDGEYMGLAPCTIEVPTRGDGLWKENLLEHTLTATPRTSGLYVQRKTYQFNQQIPKRVFFDLAVIPIQPAN